jgi:ribosomal protein S1
MNVEHDIGGALERHFPTHRAAAREFEWQSVKNRMPVGSTVEGTVAFRAHFGAWIDLGVGFPALLEIIYITDLTPERYQADDWCPVGARVRGTLFAFNDCNRQIGLRQRDPSATSA